MAGEYRGGRDGCRRNVAPQKKAGSQRGLPDQEIAEDMIVEATLRVVIHEPRGQFLGFVELRLDWARRLTGHPR